MKKFIIICILFILVIFFRLDFYKINVFKKRERPKNDIELVCEFLEDKIVIAYLHLYYDLPQFYFVPLEDLTKYDIKNIRIWDKGDLILGRCEDELKKKLINKKYGRYWHGPYLICPIPGQICKIGDHIIRNATKDIWGRRYRMFYYTYKNKNMPTETEKRIIKDEEGVFIIISGGPDGLLQSCAKNKENKEILIKTSPYVEKAKSSDFKYFDPFNQNITQPDPYIIISEKKLKVLKEEALRKYEDFLEKEKKL